jgi:hypothetical protein
VQATAVTQATTLTPAICNRKDDGNIRTTHNSRNASNIRNESNNRFTNKIWMLAKAGMLAKVVKLETACREAKKLLKSEMTAAAGTIGTSWMSTAEGPPEQRVRKSTTVEKTATFSRDTSNSSRSSQLEH